MKVGEITSYLERIAPRSYQEDYDNSGLLTGSVTWELTGTIITLDVTDEVLDEALATGSNFIIAHHPAIFRGLKKLTGADHTERLIIKALKFDIAVYAIHTNLDNVKEGVNGRIADLLGLTNTEVLLPKEAVLKKLICFAPESDVEQLEAALFAAGAGKVGNYSECNFISEGRGSFKPEPGADPTVGNIGKRETGKEFRMEFLFPAYRQTAVVQALKDAHSYEEVAYDLIPLGNEVSSVGSGIIGDLISPIATAELLKRLGSTFNSNCIRHTGGKGKLKRIAVCGGAGSFLMEAAIRAGADAFITSDLKYHEYFNGEGMFLADIGHYESEQYTSDLIIDLIRKEFPTFALRKTGVNTNPVQYYIPGK